NRRRAAHPVGHRAVDLARQTYRNARQARIVRPVGLALVGDRGGEPRLVDRQRVARRAQAGAVIAGAGAAGGIWRAAGGVLMSNNPLAPPPPPRNPLSPPFL